MTKNRKAVLKRGCETNPTSGRGQQGGHPKTESPSSNAATLSFETVFSMFNPSLSPLQHLCILLQDTTCRIRRPNMKASSAPSRTTRRNSTGSMSTLQPPKSSTDCELKLNKESPGRGEREWWTAKGTSCGMIGKAFWLLRLGSQDYGACTSTAKTMDSRECLRRTVVSSKLNCFLKNWRTLARPDSSLPQPFCSNAMDPR